MEALFHLLFQLLKILILASFYSTLIILILLIFLRIRPISRLEKVNKEKKKYWFISGIIFSIILFIYSFTYWGNHGLGDSARIPIGYFKEVGEINGTDAYIKPRNYPYGNLLVDCFRTSENYLLGTTKPSTVDWPKPYFSWYLSKDHIIFFDSELEYSEHLKAIGLSKITRCKTFRENYKDYWGGLRFWLLP
ncbi:hypothetical protein [Winogradskyella poriferorum]|uniref:hypothetical protein n=1 Tax=Winogradskyella poriferorum TaxID=307627 RepID=UPI003D65B644